jgi:hypothetical protein
MKIFESEKTLAFLDIGPLSKGHSVRCLHNLLQLVSYDISLSPY